MTSIFQRWFGGRDTAAIETRPPVPEPEAVHREVDEALFREAEPPAPRVSREALTARGLLRPLLDRDHLGRGYRDALQVHGRDRGQLYLRELVEEARALLGEHKERLLQRRDAIEAYMLGLDAKRHAGVLQEFQTERQAVERRIEEVFEWLDAMAEGHGPMERAMLAYEQGFAQGARDWLESQAGLAPARAI